MGCCCSSNEEQESCIPITIVGLPGVGKTSIIEYLADDYDPQDPPVSTNGIIVRQILIHQHLYLFYDICGYTSHSEEWIDCCSKSEAIIFVFDPFSINNARMHHTSLIKMLSPIILQKKLPTLAIFNKADDSTNFDGVANELKDSIPGIPFHSARIQKLSPDLFKIFEWIESYTVSN
ncbi:hypothetical protein M9Y10_042211 [Tritrichomonas musculus]|uniref:ADP-ribosylation factor n=1 Tax=Tritrichomonas musculus TaxID=1915356 RepID=A0ABR2K7D3_9EUKA